MNFAKGGCFDANLGVAKKCDCISLEKPRFFDTIAAGFKPIPDEEGTETWYINFPIIYGAMLQTDPR